MANVLNPEDEIIKQVTARLLGRSRYWLGLFGKKNEEINVLRQPVGNVWPLQAHVVFPRFEEFVTVVGYIVFDRNTEVFRASFSRPIPIVFGSTVTTDFKGSLE